MWINFLSLLPSTLVTVLLITMANFGVEWYVRNRETNPLAQEKQRRAEEEQRTIEEAKMRRRELGECSMSKPLILIAF